MRFRGIAIACLSLAAANATPTFAQFDEPSEQLRISTNVAATWEHAGEQVVALQGPVTIELDQATLTARQAVVWLSREAGEGGRASVLAVDPERQPALDRLSRTLERRFAELGERQGDGRWLFRQPSRLDLLQPS